jgi:hypothetical protein
VLSSFVGFDDTPKIAEQLHWSASFDGLAIERKRLVSADLIDDHGIVIADKPEQYSLSALTDIYLKQAADEQAASEQPGAAPSVAPAVTVAPIAAAVATATASGAASVCRAAWREWRLRRPGQRARRGRRPAYRQSADHCAYLRSAA